MQSTPPNGITQWAFEAGILCLAHWPSPAASRTTVILPQHDGGLYAFDLHAQQPTWSLFLGVAAQEGAFPADFYAGPCAAQTPIFASPAIAPDGTVVVGTGEGYVFRITDRS